MGRAGRFGTKGLAITFVSSASDSEVLNQVINCPESAKTLVLLFSISHNNLKFCLDLLQVQSRFEVDIKELPEQIDTSTYSKTSIPFNC